MPPNPYYLLSPRNITASAYAFTTGRLIVQHGTGLTTPAELSSTTKLTDISVDWLKVE